MNIRRSIKRSLILSLIIPFLSFIVCLDIGRVKILDDDDSIEDDTFTPFDDDDNDMTTPSDDDDDATGDDDDDSTPTEEHIFAAFGYPGYMEHISLCTYLYLIGAEDLSDDEWYYIDDEGNEFYIHLIFEPQGLIDALATEDAIVIYVGHSNFGLGPVFSDLPDNSEIEDIYSISDIVNFGTEHVAISYTFLRNEQAYPNFRISDSDIVPNPQNYIIPEIGMEKFPNSNGVDPGETFTLHGSGDYRYHYYDPNDGMYKLIVYGGDADKPELRYRTFLYKGCNTNRYFLESFRHGVFFYTLRMADYETPTAWLYVRGFIEKMSYQEIVDLMNSYDNNYGYYDFNL